MAQAFGLLDYCPGISHHDSSLCDPILLPPALTWFYLSRWCKYFLVNVRSVVSTSPVLLRYKFTQSLSELEKKYHPFRSGSQQQQRPRHHATAHQLSQSVGRCTV